RDLYAEAQTYLPDYEGTQELLNEVPTDEELLATTGNVENGKTLFQTNCATCHQVNDEGQDFGPKLSQIGAKLPKTALLESIVNTSAGISFGYENSVITLKRWSALTDIVTYKSESEVEVRFMANVYK